MWIDTRFLICSEVKDKRKKDLMDPLFIMKECVDRKKKSVDIKKKDKIVSVFLRFIYLLVFLYVA